MGRAINLSILSVISNIRRKIFFFFYQLRFLIHLFFFEMAMSETDKFMDEFDPVNSNREKRKKERAQQSTTSATTSGSNNSRRFSSNKKGSCVYDDKGQFLHDGAEVCDCLRPKCLGCFFPCPKCRSSKCAHECR